MGIGHVFKYPYSYYDLLRRAGNTAKWPGALDAWEQLGINSFPLFAHWMKDGDPLWDLVEEARNRGFFVANIDSPFHRMIASHKKNPAIFDQLPDGKTGDKLCISYRGILYQQEIERFARALARASFTWRVASSSAACSACDK